MILGIIGSILITFCATYENGMETGIVIGFGLATLLFVVNGLNKELKKWIS